MINDLYSKHQISFDNNKIMMKTYANESIDESNDTLEMTEVPEPEDIQPGTFVIAEYDFLGKNDSIKTLRLVAVVKEVIGKKYKLAYSKSLTKKRFKIDDDDVSLIHNHSL